MDNLVRRNSIIFYNNISFSSLNESRRRRSIAKDLFPKSNFSDDEEARLLLLETADAALALERGGGKADENGNGLWVHSLSKIQVSVPGM